jgi:hypothetical protein
LLAALRVGTATVWLVFGALFKLLDLVPRHRSIVAAVLGEAAAGPITLLIGGAEAAMGLWILTGASPRLCAAVQTVAIVAMNALEISLARELLIAPVAMPLANAAFLAAGWFLALRTPTTVAAA